MEKYSKAVSEMYSQFKQRVVHPLEKYLKAVSEMYSQFKQREVHPLEKYIGRHVSYKGQIREVVGYSTWREGLCGLIVDVPEGGGWSYLSDEDVVFKKCEGYIYVSTRALID